MTLVLEQGGPKRTRLRTPRVNTSMLDAQLRHRHFLMRAENGLARDLNQVIRAAERAWLGELSRVDDVAKLDLGRLSRALQGVLSNMETDVVTGAAGALDAIAERELAIQLRAVRRVLPRGVPFEFDIPIDTRTIAGQPLAGARFPMRIRRNATQLAGRLRVQAAIAKTVGDTPAQLRNRARVAFRQTVKERATLLARSETNRIANTIAGRIAQANPQTVKAEQIVETLDDATCLICAEKDGKVVPPGSPNRPPFHGRCRGAMVMVFKSWQEMGLDSSDLTAAQRKQLDGRPPVTVTYGDWFNRQGADFQREILGPTRFDRFAAGDLDVTEFARDTRILTLAELPEAA